VFESHQYLISLLRKTQNTFLDAAVRGIWLMGNFSQKGNFSPTCRSSYQDPECVKILLVPYFLIEKNAKYFRNIGDEQNLADGKISQKGNYPPNDRDLFLDHMSC
jgi:hypothetical protein